MISSRLAPPILTAWAALILIAFMSYPSQGGQERGLSVQKLRSGAAPDGRGRQWAVVIGVSNYKNVSPEAQLQFAHRDAEALAAFLRSPSGGGFPSTQIKVLINETATLSAVRTALGTWLPRSAEPDDIVFVFFAGHGVVENERDGYLMAYDTDPQNLYATALSVAELDRVITERLRARIVVLMADACHAGKIGWTSRGTEEERLINRYLYEVGQSGSGIFRLLASRADERSYEDRRWGGGHGVFTYFLLEGLKGKADRDEDGVVRAAELLDYVSETVARETQALQHPRAAGSLDPRLPIAVVAGGLSPASTIAQPVLPTVSLEIRGSPESEVYIDSVYKGKLRPDGILIIEDLNPGRHDLSVDPPSAEAISQAIILSAAKTILEVKPALEPSAPARSSPLIARILDAIERGIIFEDGGAWSLYGELASKSPSDPQRPRVETALSSALEEIGQQAISAYITEPVSKLRPDVFRRGAAAFGCLRKLRPEDSVLESKRLFCVGRDLITRDKSADAVAVLKKSASLDPKAAYVYNALGVAFEKTGEKDEALDAFKRAAQLASSWALPRIHLAIQYYLRGTMDTAEKEIKTAVDIDPNYPYARWLLTQIYRQTGHLDKARDEATSLIKFAPDYAPAYAQLGLIHEANKDYDRAVEAFETYLKLSPDSSDRDAIRERAARCRRLGKKYKPSLKRP